MDVPRSQSWGVVGGEFGAPQPDIWREGVRIIVSLRGEQDADSVAAVESALASAASTGRGDVVVDLSGIRFMDAAIIGALIGARKTLRSQSRDLTLRNPSRFARRVLDLIGLGELVDPPAATSLTARMAG